MSPRQQLDERLDLLTNEADTHLVLCRMLDFLRANHYPPVVICMTLSQANRALTPDGQRELSGTIAEARKLLPPGAQ